jgi:ABC-type polysaccharide/polyol phosphate export permease
MSEAMRAAFTPDLVPHMQIWVIYVALIGFTLALGWIGVDGFRKRVLS